MLLREICKYLVISTILLLTSCDCPKQNIPPLDDVLTDNSADWGEFQTMLAKIMGTLYLDKIFGKSIDDAREGYADHQRGILGNRKFETGVMYKMYKAISSSMEYRATYYLLFIMYIIVFGIKFLIGNTKMTVESIVPIIARVAIISMFTNPNVTGKSGLPVGWDYYYGFLIEPSLYAMEEFGMYFQASLFGWHIENVQNAFLPLTIVLKIFTSGDTWLRIISLIFAEVIPGLCVFLMILFVVAMFLVSVFFAFVTYISILTVLAVLFAIGPFYILLALFDKTRTYFMKWFMQIVSFMLQQYALFIVISIFGFIVSQSIVAMLSFSVRCDTVFSLTLGLPAPFWLKIILPFLDLIKIKIPLVKYYVANLYGDSKFLTLFMHALFLYMLVQIFSNMMLQMVSAAASLVEGTYSPAGDNAAMLKAVHGAAHGALMSAYGKMGSAGLSIAQSGLQPMGMDSTKEIIKGGLSKGKDGNDGTNSSSLKGLGDKSDKGGIASDVANVASEGGEGIESEGGGQEGMQSENSTLQDSTNQSTESSSSDTVSESSTTESSSSNDSSSSSSSKKIKTYRTPDYSKIASRTDSGLGSRGSFRK